MAQPISLVVVDDDQLVAECVGSLCRALFDAEILGYATDGDEGLALIERVRPQLAIVDLYLPGLSGLGVVVEVRQRRLPTRCIILTGNSDENWCVTAMRAGAAGYLLKTSAIDELPTALRAVSEGNKYITTHFRGALDRLMMDTIKVTVH